LTRLRKNLPPFTLRLSKAFVNGKTPVSTGFFRFSLVFLWKTPLLAVFAAGKTLGTATGAHFTTRALFRFLMAWSVVLPY
jgi:hypothetical protein